MAPQSFRWDTAPSRGPNAPEVPPAEWERHRELLGRLYIDENMTLYGVMHFMAVQHQFSATYVNAKFFPFACLGTLGRRSVRLAIYSFNISDSKRQYTLQLRKWGHFKNNSRIRSQTAIDRPLGPDSTTLPVDDASLHPTPASANAIPDFLIEAAHTRQSYMSSIAETLEVKDEETAATSTNAGSLRSTEGSNSIDMSSLSSIEDLADRAQEKAPCVAHPGNPSAAQCELCSASTAARTEPFEQVMTVPDVFIQQFQNALNAFGMTGLATPDAVLIEAKPLSFTNMERNLSMKRYRPTEFLLNTMPCWTFRRSSPADLCQMKDAADFFSAARCPHDAFAFYGAISFQTIIQQGSSPTTSSLSRAAIDVIRTATSDSDFAYVDWLTVNHLSQEPEVVLANTAEACLLHLHLSICSLARGNIRQAAESCRVGLEGYSKLRGYHNFLQQARCSGFDVATSIHAQLEGNLAAAHALQNGLSPNDLSLGDTLIGLLYGFTINLADDGFRKMLDSANEALWKEAPKPKSLTSFETTALFCYLWTRWQAGKTRSQSSPQSSYRHSRLAHLEDKTGVRPLDALAALSVLILAFESDLVGTCGSASTRPSLERAIDIIPQKSTLPCRALTLCRDASLAPPAVIFPAFLRCYAASANSRRSLYSANSQGPPYSTAKYRSLVRDFVCEFADSHLSIELWEGVGDDPRLPSEPSRASFSSSLSPTMISAPRSSWSGYASFRSLHQRTKEMTSGSGCDEPPSISSGLRLSTETSSFRRRWSSLSSKRSSRSSIVSMIDVDPEDIMMLNDA
jgi:hypothetical protein